MNKILKHKCMQNIGMSFIDNSSLDGTYLNGSNIHLNTGYIRNKGSTILATKFIKYLRGNKPSMSSRNDKNFRMTTVHQLEDLPRMIGVLSRDKYQEKKHS